MIRRLAWIAALVVVALVTTFAQLDRVARFNPVLAPAVPGPFRGFAQAILVQQALARGDADEAAQLARRLVLVRPAPAENLTLLSQAQLEAGNPEAGLAALEEAGKRGWREPVSQAALAQAALLAGNAEAASLRVVALLATGTVDSEMVSGLLADLVALPDGRAALGRRLSEAGYWQDALVARGPQRVGPEAYVDILVEAQRRGARLDCASLDRGLRTLRSVAPAVDASAIRENDCQR